MGIYSLQNKTIPSERLNYFDINLIESNVIHDDILEYKFQFVIWEKMIQLTRGYLGFPVIQNVLLM